MTHGVETRLDGSTLVLRIPMRFQRRGGRKRIVAPDGSELAPVSKPQPDILRRAAASQYQYAAGYVRECAALSSRLGADTEVESHAAFLQRLGRDHGRKYKFWHLLGELSAEAGDRGLSG